MHYQAPRDHGCVAAIVLLPSGEKVGGEAARMRGRASSSFSLKSFFGLAAPSSVSLRLPPYPPRGEGS